MSRRGLGLGLVAALVMLGLGLGLSGREVTTGPARSLQKSDKNPSEKKQQKKKK